MSRKLEAIVAGNVTGVTAAEGARDHLRGVMKFDSQSNAAARPDWTHSVPKPETFSAVWLLYILSRLSMPIAIVAVIAAAKWLGWIELN